MNRKLIVCLVLVAAVAAVYGQTLGFDFVNFDDPDYVGENQMVSRGLSAEGFAWAFRAQVAQNWHPLTWLSLMADASLHGVDSARGFHLSNLLLHAVNAVLLFLLLTSLTGAFWRSALVAGLFALHPLHVESVAWIAERKDVLSQLFALLACLAYMRWARGGRRIDYLLALLLLALGLMAKQMLVSLPLLWLLLDYWPLKRLNRDAVIEKIPALLLAAGAVAMTLAAQTRRATLLPLDDRLGNALVALPRYLGKLVAPIDLSVLYPHPAMAGGEPLAAWQVSGAFALLLLIGAVVWRLRCQRWLTVGWSWFLIAMLPVIGIVQVGEQAMADRYAYLPFIGLYIIMAWGLTAIVKRSPAFMMRVGPALAVVALLACAGGSFARVGVWRNSVTLWEAAVLAPPTHPKALYNLGLAHSHAGRYDQAIMRFEGALAIRPDYVKALNNLGLAREKQGDTNGARSAYERVLGQDPRHLQALINYSGLLTRLGDLPNAIELRRRAVAVEPNSAPGRNNLGALLAQAGQFDEAEREFRFALRLDPGSRDARRNLALLARIREQGEKKDPPPGTGP